MESVEEEAYRKYIEENKNNSMNEINRIAEKEREDAIRKYIEEIIKYE